MHGYNRVCVGVGVCVGGCGCVWVGVCDVCDVLLCGFMGGKGKWRVGGGKGKWRVGGDQPFLLILENNIVNCKLNSHFQIVSNIAVQINGLKTAHFKYLTYMQKILA